VGARDLAIGRRFELLECVGRGAFGEVFRAREVATGELAAVKRLHEHRCEPVIIERFEREGRMLARIDSPHVVRYLAHGHDERGRPCLALEWLAGEDLAQRQRSRPLDVADAVEATRQAALGLAALHEAGIVHRDVKPSNFCVLPPVQDGARVRIKLLDLGIARTDAELALTMEGVRVGTPSYMSPEQVRGEDVVGPRSDLFSLGAMLYELLSGRRPFPGNDEVVVLAKVLLYEPRPLEELCPQLGRELVGIVTRALRKAPEERFESAAAMVAELAAAPLPTGSPAAEHARGEGAETEEVAAAASVSSTSLSATREQRVVTAVFAGFADTAEPSTAMETFSRITAAHGGVTHRTLGWRMIAIFGSVRSTGDEAVRAARAALGATETIGGVQLSIATGRAVAGAGELSADAIERGAENAPGLPRGVRVDAPTARLISGHFTLEARGAHQLLTGARAGAPAAGPRLLGRETPTVGRDKELATLEATYEECVSEPVARAVLISAPAGAGKSRLRYELVRRLQRREDPPCVLIARGDSLRAGSPFGMVADVIRQLAGVSPGESADRAAARLSERVAACVRPPDRARVTAFLAETAAIPLPPALIDERTRTLLTTARADAISMGDAKRAAWEDWLEAETRERPLVLVFEDLHWGDLPTVKLVDAALRRLADRPLMVLALARPEVHEQFPELWKARELSEIRLGGLTRKACERLVREAIGDLDAERTASIVERADGNAFFLEELIRAVAEGTAELPATVLGMVQARLDALGSEMKRVLRAASVFGGTFTRAGVVQLCGGAHGDRRAPPQRTQPQATDPLMATVTTALDELVRREVINRRQQPDRDPERTEHVFRHAIVRDAAYAMLADDDRAVGHRLAGAWLEACGDADAIVLAEHYERGGEPARALAWYHRAADDALQGNDLAAVIQRAERGAACGATGTALGLLRLLQGEAHRWLGHLEPAIACGQEAVDRLPVGSAAWFRASAELGAAAGRRGDYDRVERTLFRAAAVTAQQGAISAQVAALCPGASQLIQAGRYDAADRLLVEIERIVSPRGSADEALAPTSGRPSHGPLSRPDLAAGVDLDSAAIARLEQLRAFRAFRRGDPASARIGYATALSAFERAGSVRNAAIERVNLAFAHASVGCFEEAEANLRDALADAERMGLHAVQGYALLNLGRVLSELGRLDEAKQNEVAALTIGERENSPRIVGAARTHLASIALREGDHAAARDHARAAIELLAVAPPLQAGALAIAARVELADGRLTEARPLAERAKASVDAGLRDMFDALVRRTWAEVLHASGELEAARTEIAAAKAHLESCAAAFKEEAIASSFLHRVVDHAATLELAAAWGVR
jgi:tetratricopeptide (TPR) repeat protein